MDEDGEIPEKGKLEFHILIAYLHNNRTIIVEGNEVSIDMLKDVFFNVPELRSMRIYTNDPEPKKRKLLKSWNYTELKRLRS